MPKEVDQQLQTAFSLHRAGKLDKAASIYREIVDKDPNNFYALQYLGVIEASLGHFEQAKALMARSVVINPPNIQFIENYAAILFQTGDYDSALQICVKGLQLDRTNVSLLYVSAISKYKLRQLQEALVQFDKLLSLEPNHIAALNERGSVLAEMKKYDVALASFEKALKLQPQYAEAWLNQGNALSKLKRYDHASAAYDKALAFKPNLPNAWLGRGNIERGLKRYDDAFAAYDRALALEPELAGAWLGRGNVFEELKRHDDALAAYDKALALEPDLAGAWLGRANVFEGLKRYEDALAAYDKALALEPDLIGAEGARLHCKMHLCDWSNCSVECKHLISAIKNNERNSEPFSFVAISTSREDQLKCAKLWVSEKYQVSAQPIWDGEIYNHDKIRVAYVSADFREHATSYLMAGMFECHDKTKFEITAISIGPDDGSALRGRLKDAFDDFLDGSLLSDDEIARWIRQKEIDILIDLNGFTQNARTGIFARRPAPVQVNYLGFPGTMGASYIDYLFADATLVPQSHQQDYSEKIVYLPNSYQVNDTKRAVSERALAREGMGLKDNSFVFCCFNNNYKITPETFDRWSRVLKQVDGSVLWLLESNATAAGNLRKEARSKGLDPDRLIFAPLVPLPDHLARHRCADLFLDTLPYNAHTTASDALWAGLPVLTQIGETFAGRVAASLLIAIGLPELIASTPQAYEELAIELATNPKKLAAIKYKLASNRLTTPLFDTQLFTRHIERAHEAIYERYQTGLAPDHVYVTQ